MLVTIGQKPLADFTQPLEMMKDCHRRIEYFLDLLSKVEQQCGAGELHEEGRRALKSAVKYFAEFAPRHTADEEASLFPRLRESYSAEARAVLRAFPREVPAGVTFYVRLGLVERADPDQFEALVGQAAVFRMD